MLRPAAPTLRTAFSKLSSSPSFIGAATRTGFCPSIPMSSSFTITSRMMSTIAAPPVMNRTRRLVLGVGSAAAIFGLGVAGAIASEEAPVSVALDTPQWSPEVRRRLRSTYTALAAGLGLTGISAYVSYGAAMSMSPMGMLGVTLVGGIGSMLALYAIPKENVLAKGAAFAAFQACMGFSVAPLAVLGGPVLLKAAVYTCGIVGSLSVIAATSPSENWLWMAGPLSIGLGVVFVSSLAPLFLPASSAIASTLANVSLYGGLALFSGFTLYDTAKVIHHAEVLPKGEFDPWTQCLGIYLDALNIFVRLAIILGGNNKRR